MPLINSSLNTQGQIYCKLATVHGRNILYHETYTPITRPLSSDLEKKGWNLNDTEAVVCRLATSSENKIWNYHSKKIIWSEKYSWSSINSSSYFYFLKKKIVEVTSLQTTSGRRKVHLAKCASAQSPHTHITSTPIWFDYFSFSKIGIG